MDSKIKVYTPKETLDKFGFDDTILLDIRENEMLGFKRFDVPKQINISNKELDEKWVILPLNKLIIVADTSGVFARKSAEFLFEQGFNVAILAGGIVEWERDGLKLVENSSERLSGSCMCQLRPREN